MRLLRFAGSLTLTGGVKYGFDFIKILNMSITASWLILAVLVLRLILKKLESHLMRPVGNRCDSLNLSLLLESALS